LLVEFDDGSLGVGSELGRGGTEGVRRLQGMAPLNTAFALAAPADVDVELAVDGLARDLDLVLLGYMRLVERAAAVGAAVWQRCLVDLIDLFGAGRLAVRLGAVVLAGLAALWSWAFRSRIAESFMSSTPTSIAFSLLYLYRHAGGGAFGV
jgi:hypothetical protein